MFKKLCFRVIANTPSRLVFFSRCRLLSPREIAKSFSANGMVGRGGGVRTRDPRLVRFHPRDRKIGPIDCVSGLSMPSQFLIIDWKSTLLNSSHGYPSHDPF